MRVPEPVPQWWCPVTAWADPDSPPLSAAVWVGSTRRVLGRRELVAMLTALRAETSAKSLTGLLLYDAGTFMHAVEGPPTGVGQLLAHDLGRHRDLIVMHREPSRAREFASWSMGFADPARRLSDVPGYSSYLSDAEDTLARDGVMSLLLRSFHRTVRG